MATFTDSGVRVDVTLRDLNISSGTDMYSRTVDFTVQVWALGAKSEATDGWHETWTARSACGEEGFSAGDLFNLIDQPEDIDDSDWFELEGTCDAIWDRVLDWFAVVGGEIYSAQKAVVPEYIERANDGAFDPTDEEEVA